MFFARFDVEQAGKPMKPLHIIPAIPSASIDFRRGLAFLLYLEASDFVSTLKNYLPGDNCSSINYDYNGKI